MLATPENELAGTRGLQVGEKWKHAQSSFFIVGKKLL
jgi:hypothetical protein